MKVRIVIVVSLLGLILTSQAGAAPKYLPHGAHLSVKQKVAYFERSVHKDQTAIRWLVNHHVKKNLAWRRTALRWQTKMLKLYRAQLAPPAPPVGYWVSRQIAIATKIALGSSKDPWPHCPDPYDGSGSSWYDTVQCENGGNWYDSPGYYRCGLQFDPGWETKYGRLCP